MDTLLNKTLKIRYALSLAICLFFSISADPIDLKGEQEGSYGEGEYVVSGDVVIPPQKEMILEAGAVLRFKPYTGIKISGKLTCNGSSLKSILFTSIADTNSIIHENGSFVQWNGIEVDSSASLAFDRVEIFNSVYGLKADENSDSLILKDVLFKNNTEDFRIGDSLIMVDNNSLFKGRFNAVDTTKLLDKKVKKEKSKGKIALQVSLATVGVAGAVIAGVYHNKYKDEYDKYRNVEEFGTSSYRENVVDRDYTIRNVSGAAGLAALTGLVITFLF